MKASRPLRSNAVPICHKVPGSPVAQCNNAHCRHRRSVCTYFPARESSASQPALREENPGIEKRRAHCDDMPNSPGRTEEERTRFRVEIGPADRARSIRTSRYNTHAGCPAPPVHRAPTGAVPPTGTEMEARPFRTDPETGTGATPEPTLRCTEAEMSTLSWLHLPSFFI
jgi:hypothetical protein